LVLSILHRRDVRGVIKEGKKNGKIESLPVGYDFDPWKLFQCLKEDMIYYQPIFLFPE